jgi:anti-anti-sigma factor
LQQALTHVLEQGRARILVDLDQLSFMDVSTLNAMVAASQRVSADGVVFQIRCSGGHRRRLLSLTGLERMLEPADAGPTDPDSLRPSPG